MIGALPKTKKGNMYILTVQLKCSLTKWIEAYPMRNQRTVTCTSAFIHNWVCCYGVPDRIHLDQGSKFESTINKEICQLLHVSKSKTTRYHLEGIGQIENFHRTSKGMLKVKAEEEPHDWDVHLVFCLIAYRSSIHASTNSHHFRSCLAEK